MDKTVRAALAGIWVCLGSVSLSACCTDCPPCGTTSDVVQSSQDTKTWEGFEDESCLAGMCMSDEDCEKGFQCSFAIDTGLADRGRCQELGCGSQGSVCDEDQFCAPGLVCNHYYATLEQQGEAGQEGQSVEPKAQCQPPGTDGAPCSDSDECDYGYGCNLYYAMPQCRKRHEYGNLCSSSGDCHHIEDEPGICSMMDRPCFFGLEDCIEEAGSEESLSFGYCQPEGDVGDSCLEDNDCIYEWGDGSGLKKLRCIFENDLVNEYGSPKGHCRAPGGPNQFSNSLCLGHKQCPVGEFCIHIPGHCGVPGEEGEECDNGAPCAYGLKCAEGICVDS